MCGMPRRRFSRRRRCASGRGSRTSGRSGDRAPSTSSSPTSCRRCRRPVRVCWAKQGNAERHRVSAADQRRATAGAQPLTPRVETPVNALSPRGAPLLLRLERRRRRPRRAAAGSRRRHCRARPRRRSRPSRRHRSRRSEELRAGDARDAQEPATGRLADLPAQLSGPQLQPAESDHAREREEPAAAVGVVDERLGRESDDPDRAQRHHLSRDARATSCRRSTARRAI